MEISTRLYRLVKAVVVIGILWFLVTETTVKTKSFSLNDNCLDTISKIEFSPDSHYLAVKAKQVFVWDVKTGKLQYRIGERPTSMTFSPNSKYLLVGEFLGEVMLYDLSTGKVIKTFSSKKQISPNSAYYSFAIKFLPDNEQILIADFKGTHLWDVKTGKKIRSFPDLFPNSNADDYVEITPDGKYILLTSVNEDSFSLWDIQSARLQHNFETDYAYFSPDGRYILTYTVNSELLEGNIVWDVNNHTKIFNFPSTNGGEISPNGKYILNKFYENPSLTVTGLGIWNLETGNLIRRISDYDGLFGVATFTVDSQSILVHLGYKGITTESTYNRQDIVTGKEAYTTKIKDNIFSFTVSPDNSVVAVRSNNGYIYIHDLENGTELRKLCSNPASPVSSP